MTALAFLTLKVNTYQLITVDEKPILAFRHNAVLKKVQVRLYAFKDRG